MFGNNVLTKIEELVMKCIWDTEEAMALSELTKMVNSRYQKDWRPQTISTYLALLVKKGCLRMERKGRGFLYYPLLSRDEYFDYRLHALVAYWQDLAAPIDFFRCLTSK